MRIKPEQFHDFKLLFSLSSQSTQTKQTVIRIDNIVNGHMMTQLLQRFNQSTKEILAKGKRREETPDGIDDQRLDRYMNLNLQFTDVKCNVKSSLLLHKQIYKF